MAKRFKLRISRVITSLQTCRSKDPSTLPSDPVPSFLRLSSPTHLIPTEPHHHRSSFKRHVITSAFTSTACALRSNRNSPARPHTQPPPEFKWRKEDKWHVVAKAHNDDDNTPRQKIYNSSASGHSADDIFPPAARKKLRNKHKKKTAGGVRLRLSTTSSASLFSSSEAEEESETLVSTSRSFSTSTDSSASTRRRPIKSKKKKNDKRGGEKSRGRGSGGGGGGSGGESPARLSSVFKRMIPCGVLEGKVKESYAVVKRSEDPKEDFKRSMMEMVVEKQMFEEGELEQLLRCFLSLNSRSHQGVIVEAFTEIWEALFSSTTTSTSTRRV
ncbi:transcription repressor OFP7 [Rhododendron vialii]|uniref:transcription repressor OFP7 n=1 Tax=Rhododendron vialii TaxID=182163 RepID=UPI00265E5A70|nr:transcription repressor OFP7 [Rhododendron vialii]